jgi:tetratricopeptide (TPR) repeat protein
MNYTKLLRIGFFAVMINNVGICGKEGVMKNENLQKLIDKAAEMALDNIWNENAFEVNMKILEIDNNSAACTRLAKYFMLNDNLADAKDMYIKALEINPNNQGAKNNLNKIEESQMETQFIDKMTTSRESYNAGQEMMKKGKYGFAVKCYLKAYNIEPLLKYRISLARAYSKQGEHDKIKKLYRELLDNHPSRDVMDAINVGFGALLKA